MKLTENIMADRLPIEWIDELRARSDIVQIVSETVRLKRSGNRYWGVCPFHNEKTASFSVSADQQLFYCFGCKAGGDVVKFVMDIERIGYMDALKYLSDRAHYPMPEQSFDPEAYKARRTERDRIFELNRSAARFYHERLWTPEGAAILDYFHRRGLDDAAIRRFGLGASPDDGQTLTRLLGKSDDDKEIMLKAGLSGRKDGRIYDFFRGRAMFPILGLRGEVLGFGARTLGDAQPKYLNTSDTPVFNKRQGVYGAHLLKSQRDLKRIVLVEGYMDALSLLTHGVAGVVATLGTSLTPEQIKLMTRYAPEIWIAYDGDEPGQKAALRAIDMCEEHDVPARVVRFPDQLDPDEFIRSENAKPFDELERLTPPQYKLLRLVRDYDLKNPEDRMNYAMAAAKVLRNIKEPVELENLLGRLVIETDYPRDVLIRQIEHSRADIPKAERAATGSARVTRGEPNAPFGTFIPEPLKAARILLSMLCANMIGAGRIAPDDFNEPAHRDMATRLIGGQSLASILSDYEDQEDWRREALEVFAVSVVALEERVPQMVNDLIERIKTGRITLNFKSIQASLTAAQGATRSEGLSKLQNMLEEKHGLKTGRKE
jgi:DNA primase